MQALTNSELLSLWEHGYALHPLDRNLLILGAAYPGTPYDRLADWPLGRGNRALAEVYVRSFGAALRGWVSCPQCAEKLEFELDARSLANTAEPGGEPIAVNGEPFRLPTVRDLARAAQVADSRSAAVGLVESCRIDPGAGAELSEHILEAIEERMAEADPLAETVLTFRCTGCEYHWSESLDIGSFLWLEIQARAKRLLREVHTLAAAYRWSEEHILAMSEARRAAYLEMVET